MHLVKWVLEKDLFASYTKIAEYQERDNIAAPVIPLADLTVFLREKADHYGDLSNQSLQSGHYQLAESQRDKAAMLYTILSILRSQLEAHRKEG